MRRPPECSRRELPAPVARGWPVAMEVAVSAGRQAPPVRPSRRVPVPRVAPAPPPGRLRPVRPARSAVRGRPAGSGAWIAPARPRSPASPLAPSASEGAAAPAADRVPAPGAPVPVSAPWSRAPPIRDRRLAVPRPRASIRTALPDPPPPLRPASRRSDLPPPPPRMRPGPPWRPSPDGAVPVSVWWAAAAPGAVRPVCRPGVGPASARRDCRRADRDCAPARCAVRTVAPRSPRSCSTHSSPRCRAPCEASP